jgi:hypothetical protein
MYIYRYIYIYIHTQRYIYIYIYIYIWIYINPSTCRSHLFVAPTLRAARHVLGPPPHTHPPHSHTHHHPPPHTTTHNHTQPPPPPTHPPQPPPTTTTTTTHHIYLYIFSVAICLSSGAQGWQKWCIGHLAGAQAFGRFACQAEHRAFTTPSCTL